MNADRVPSARLLIATGCAHCATAIEGLTRLVKTGQIDRLEIINLLVTAGKAPKMDRRTLPQIELGPFRFEGALSTGELAEWAKAAASGGGWPAYLAYLLDHRRFEEAKVLIEAHPERLAGLLGLLAEPDTPLATRIGIGALMEDLAGRPLARAAIPTLETLTLSCQPQTRADACHYLGLIGDPTVIPCVRRLLDDDDDEVSEIAAETLALLGNSPFGEGGRP
ncbi:MAG: HEAT repeat domain-containing protein [Chromatiaceae bacterium]|nr:HEAT repeat domain-containing protein [Candidatus Thioaporhodococcus sediminis]